MGITTLSLRLWFDVEIITMQINIGDYSLSKDIKTMGVLCTRNP